jgi:predicted RNA-binding protein with PUA-like domain
MTKITSHWLMKSEPDAYGWDDLVAEGEGTWDGVRNHRAANNLRAMRPGDLAFFYHSNVGMVEISEAGLSDPTDETGRWASVKVRPVRKFARPVTLKQIKADPALATMELVRLPRLSVGVVTAEEWDHILTLAGGAARCPKVGRARVISGMLRNGTD